MSAGRAAPDLSPVFAPVRSQTAFEETVDRIGTAIKLGLLPPGARLPAERELCGHLEISRSTLRQALTALGQSGHLRAVRGRGGGTFVVERPPRAAAPPAAVLARWRDACDARLAIELGVAALAAERAPAEALDELAGLVDEMDGLLEDFPAYRRADVRFHLTLAEAAGSRRLLAAATEVQSEMTDLIGYIAHPSEILASANAQHERLVGSLRRRDATRAIRLMTEHLQGTEHVLAGLLPGPG